MNLPKFLWELVQSEVPREVLIGVIVFLIGTSVIGISRWLYRQVRMMSWESTWTRLLSPAGLTAVGVIGVLLLFGLLYVDVRRNQNEIRAIREIALTLKPEPDAGASPAPVQAADDSPSGLDPHAQRVDETQIRSGFLPDPDVSEVVGGGPVDASYLDGEDCIGYTTEAPNFRVQWSGESDELRIFFTPMDEEGDSTLLVRLPDGSWSCNDDSEFSLDPLVLLDDPKAGRYNIWVGSYSPDREISGKLSVTELNLGPPPFLRADQ